MVSEYDVLSLAREFEGMSEEVLQQERGQTRRSLRVFKVDGRIFLVVWEGTDPLRIEVKCDGRLGKLLRQKYESVLLSQTLGGNGIEVICSGQLGDDEVVDLVRHSYARATEEQD